MQHTEQHVLQTQGTQQGWPAWPLGAPVFTHASLCASCLCLQSQKLLRCPSARLPNQTCQRQQHVRL